jgi:hypothetical protein
VHLVYPVVFAASISKSMHAVAVVVIFLKP